MKQQGFRFGEWTVDVAGNALVRADVRTALEPRAMDVLRYLCRHPGAVIPAEEILQACWGTAELGDNPIHKAIAQLRRALGDSSTAPRYIETVRKRGYRALAEVVEEEEQAGIWQDGSPFRGLEAFEENHAAIFFGRMQATTQLRETVLKQADGGCAMALVLGPSGSGKTSLVRAGLLPQLCGGDGPVALSCLLHMDCADLGGGDLFGALAAVLVDAEFDGVHLFDGSSAEALGERLRSDPLSVAAQLSAREGAVRIAIFVDRLEAIFRAPNTSDADRARFIALLDLLATHRVLVLLACRNDFYPELIALPELMALKARGGHFDLEPPDGADIAQMVRLPARAAGLTFEIDPTTGASLDDVLCDEARGSPDALPLLQYCLNELYRQRGEDGSLRFAVFRQLGGIEGALGVRAEQIVSALPASQQEALPHVLSLLVSVGDEQNAVTARRAAWAALQGGAEQELVTALIEARLFVSELTADVASFGVAHEALLRRWPRVVEWVERHREALQVRTRISSQATRWAVGGRPRDLLLPEGIQLTQANSLLKIAGLPLSSDEIEYIQTSHRRARSFKQLRLALLTTIAVLGVISIGLGLTARTAQSTAERHRSAAEGLMTSMLSEFVDKLRPLGRLDLLDSVSKQAFAYLANSDSAGVDQRVLPQRAKALQVIAEVHVSRADPANAKAALQSARLVLTQLDSEKTNDKSFLLDLGANSFWLGQIAFEQGDLDTARSHMSEYLRIASRLVALDRRDPKGWIEQSYAHSGLGSIALSHGSLDDAATHFHESIRLEEAALSKTPNNDELKADLADSLSWLATTEAKLGKLQSALELYAREKTLLNPLHNGDGSNALWAYRLAIATWHSADISAALGDLVRSRSDYVKAKELLDSAIANDPTNHAWKLDRLKVTLRQLGTESTTAQSSTLLAKLHKIEEELMELNVPASPNIELAKTLALARQQRGEHYLLTNRLGDADAASQNALALLGGISSKQRSDLQFAGSFANALITRARVLYALHDEVGAHTLCRQVQELLQPAGILTVDYALLVPLGRSFTCTNDIQKAAEVSQRLEAFGYADPRAKLLNFYP